MIYVCKYFCVNAIEFPQSANPVSVVIKAQAVLNIRTYKHQLLPSSCFSLADVVYSILYVTLLITK